MVLAAAYVTVHHAQSQGSSLGLWLGIAMMTLPSVMGSIALLLALWCARRPHPQP